MFKRREQNGRFLGYELERDGVFYFFGSRFMAREDLTRIFPDYEFVFIKQVHGRRVIEATPLAEADGHYTSQVGRALVVQSADCVPVLLASEQGVCGIHAGWRGVAQDIVGAAGLVFPRATFAAVGPHIGAPSFQVGADVNSTLIQASDKRFSRSDTEPEKFRFDLKGATEWQLHRAYSPRLPVVFQNDDTVTSPEFHSFRRDRELAGRQFSFVVLNR